MHKSYILCSPQHTHIQVYIYISEEMGRVKEGSQAARNLGSLFGHGTTSTLTYYRTNTPQVELVYQTPNKVHKE